MKKLPELLSPAGSFEALKAAIDGGADAIYMGGASFNARINAENFGHESMGEAVRLAHAYGVKLYQTVNTMIFDREREDFLRMAESSARLGIDAFIVSDLGAAELLHEYLPEIPLHASTQMSIHNAPGARLLEKHGFTRVVPARELSREDIACMVKNTSLEIEMFIHGALCVSHSGQCLFSSIVGGRSGNRGLCAQPCRLPYACGGEKAGNRYSLSLKDLSLAEHIEEIIASGVASLKIEGRMKSPEYVRGVTAIYRELLDTGENATKEDLQRLADFFSRGGFTDSYYKKTVGHGMLGVRSEEDKQASRNTPKFNKITRKIPIEISAEIFEGENSRLTLSLGERRVTVCGAVAQRAMNAPISRENVEKCLSKLGAPPFMVGGLDIKLGENVMMPISALNALRREGAEKLMTLISEVKEPKIGKISSERCQNEPKHRNFGRFYSTESISDKARGFFDVILLPLDKYCETTNVADGFWMPEVTFDREWEGVEKMLIKSAEKHPEYVVVSNLGQLEKVRQILPHAGLIADFRFNIGNSRSALFSEKLGFESYVASAELTLPQLRDLEGAKAAIVYGRIPLMLLEKCVIKELYGERRGCDICGKNEAKMRDRRGFIFPVMRTAEHRNLIFNSTPTYMADRQDALLQSGITDRHFIFTTETQSEIDGVIEAYKTRRPPSGEVRRI